MGIIAGVLCPGLTAAALRPLTAGMAGLTKAAGGNDGEGGGAPRATDGAGGVWAANGMAFGWRQGGAALTAPAATGGGHGGLLFHGEVYNFAELLSASAGALAALEAGHAHWPGHGPAGGPGAAAALLALAAPLLREVGDAGATAALGALLSRLRGAFAGALVDADGRRLWLFRDRMGGEPLYFGRVTLPLGGAPRPAIVFANRVTACRALPGFAPAINRAAVAQLTARGCCHDCIWEGFHKLPPGGLLELAFDRPGAAEPTRWWTPSSAAQAAQAAPFRGSAAEAAEALVALLRDALREQTADGPAGVLLSGGVDSSLLAALMAAQATTGPRPRTFTIGVADPGFDESAAAAAVAGHLQTAHHPARLADGEVLAMVERLPRIYDEPFADSSQIPTLALCRAAREHAAVALAGDGGDESFGGYERYRAADFFRRHGGRLPRDVRRALGTLLSLLPPELGNFIGALGRPAYPRRYGDKAGRLARALGAADFAGFYARLTESGEPALMPGAPDDGTAARFRAALAAAPGLGGAGLAMLLDLAAYIPDDTGVKINLAAADAGLIVRSPLLDPRVIDFALRLPPEMKFRRAGGRVCNKWLLRVAAGRWLPPGLLDARKKGFGAPLAGWLRGPLCEWAGDMLTGKTVGDWFDAPLLAQMWQEHRRGRRDHAAALWNVLMFLAWEREWRPAR